MLEKLDNVVLSNGDIDLDDIDSDLLSHGMGLVTIDLTNINLDDNFDSDNPAIILFVRLKAWLNRFKQCKSCKKG